MSVTNSDHYELASNARQAFQALWPRRDSPDDVEAWVSRMATVLGGIPLDACWLAVDEWCDTMTKWPAPTELAQMARRFSKSAEPPPSPNPSGRASESFARAHIDVIRKITAVGAAALDAHDHHQGAAGCPVCGQPSKVDGILADLPEPTPALSRCRGCPGTGWTELADGSVHPCPQCNADGFDAWENGYTGRRQRWSA